MIQGCELRTGIGMLRHWVMMGDPLIVYVHSSACAWDEIAIIADVDGDDSRSARIGVREGVCLNASECSPACLA